MILKLPAIYVEDKEVIRNFRINITETGAFRCKCQCLNAEEIKDYDILVSDISSPKVSISTMSVQFDIVGMERKGGTTFRFHIKITTNGVTITCSTNKHGVKEINVKNFGQVLRELQNLI